MLNQTLQFDWALIPAGAAWIGGAGLGEGPRQSMFVPAFAIMTFKVTNTQFRTFVEEGGYHRPEYWSRDEFGIIAKGQIAEPAFWRDNGFNQPDQPVTGVSFHEAQAFARWAGCRLPTEVEWHKAAGGAEGRQFPWGDDQPDHRRAHFAPDYSPSSRSTRSVHECELGDSPYGCRQMAGNVYEWCIDYFKYDTPARRTTSSLVELRPSSRRVLKGGAWTTGASRLRVAARWSAPPLLRDNIVGFRLVRPIGNGDTHNEEDKEDSAVLPRV